MEQSHQGVDTPCTFIEEKNSEAEKEHEQASGRVCWVDADILPKTRSIDPKPKATSTGGKKTRRRHKHEGANEDPWRQRTPASSSTRLTLQEAKKRQLDKESALFPAFNW